MRKLPKGIAPSSLVACFALCLLFLSGCKPNSTTTSTGDSFVFTTPDPTPKDSSRSNSASTEEEEDHSPAIPGFLTENKRKQLLALRFAYEEKEAPPPMIESPSGLKYRILEQGTGKQVTPDARISANFVANLEDGVRYESLLTSGKKGDIPEKMFSPVTYLLRDMIPAWQEGLILLKEGGLIEMEIPPALGYGEDGFTAFQVPPNARLFHIVRVLTVNAKMFRDIARDQISAENFKQSDGQIFYKIINQTEGKRPSFTDIVTINYIVHRIDGKKLIDTYESGEPDRTPVIRLTPGMAEAVKMIGEGGIIELILPPEKGFGRHSQTDKVPDNCYVRVKLELVKTEPNRKLRLPTGEAPPSAKKDSASSQQESEEKSNPSPEESPESPSTTNPPQENSGNVEK